MKKIRADILVTERGLCSSRSEAQRLILAGEVRTGPDSVVRKAGQLLAPDVELFVMRRREYVSRGAHKLLAAIEAFQPPLEGVVALDLGASTGGFTEVLLKHGARRVYAVDVGYGQLHYRLRRDERVICLERTNARYLTPELVPETIEVLTGDVSFISLTKVLPPCVPLLAPDAWVMVLVKPQFEAGREEVGKGGVVRDLAVRKRCVDTIVGFAESTLGWRGVGVVPSPIKGPKGNQEFVAVFRNGSGASEPRAIVAS
ncbi:MAG: TlyA family RNA methyltransferase [Lentisphaeria bacterium]|nr:TlyA family RNA methyltransferase [Lentisphaeria bacterium]